MMAYTQLLVFVSIVGCIAQDNLNIMTSSGCFHCYDIFTECIADVNCGYQDSRSFATLAALMRQISKRCRTQSTDITTSTTCLPCDCPTVTTQTLATCPSCNSCCPECNKGPTCDSCCPEMKSTTCPGCPMLSCPTCPSILPTTEKDCDYGCPGELSTCLLFQEELSQANYTCHEEKVSAQRVHLDQVALTVRSHKTAWEQVRQRMEDQITSLKSANSSAHLGWKASKSSHGSCSDFLKEEKNESASLRTANGDLTTDLTACQRNSRNISLFLEQAYADTEILMDTIQGFSTLQAESKNVSETKLKDLGDRLSTCEQQNINETINLRMAKNDLKECVSNNAKCEKFLLEKTDYLKECKVKLTGQAESLQEMVDSSDKCEKDLENCGLTLNQIRSGQQEMLNTMKSDLDMVGRANICCNPKGGFKCDTAMFSENYTCLPVFLTQDLCIGGVSQGQELWGIHQCLALNDKTLWSMDWDFIVGFMEVNPYSFSVLVLLMIGSGLGLILTFVVVILCLLNRRKPIGPITERLLSLPDLPSYRDGLSGGLPAGSVPGVSHPSDILLVRQTGGPLPAIHQTFRSDESKRIDENVRRAQELNQAAESSSRGTQRDEEGFPMLTRPSKSPPAVPSRREPVTQDDTMLSQADNSGAPTKLDTVRQISETGSNSGKECETTESPSEISLPTLETVKNSVLLVPDV